MQIIILAVVLLLYGCGSRAEPFDKLEEFRLDNGMTFLLFPHGETDVFSAEISFHVGGLDEDEGMTGMAHMVEHMAFKGTKRWGTKNWPEEEKVLLKIEEVGTELSNEYAGKRDKKRLAALRKNLRDLHEEHGKLVEREEVSREFQRRGGTNLNATTSKDLTNYFVSLPSSELEFWAEMEAQRIFSPVYREFYLERDVIMEERRGRIEDDPAGLFYTTFLEKAFEGGPYGRPTLGKREDILAYTATKALGFFREHYRPDRAVGVIVGRFDVGEAKEILRRTFGKIPTSQTSPSPYPLPRGEGGGGEGGPLRLPPYNRKDCRIDLTRLGAQPRLAIAFHKPAMPERDDYVFDLIATILTDDRSSRLYRELVVSEGLAASLDSYSNVPGSRLPNLFMIFAVPRGEVSLDLLERKISSKLDNIDSITDKEIEVAKKKLTSERIWRMEMNDSLASELSYFQTMGIGWRYLVEYPEVIESITKEELLAVVKRYFTDGNRCVGFLHGTE